MRLKAAATRPTSVPGSASGARGGSATSPLASGSSLTRVAVAATRLRGRSDQRTQSAPTTPVTTRAAPKTIAATASSRWTALSTGSSGSPTSSTSPSRPHGGDDAVVVQEDSSTVCGLAVDRDAGQPGRILRGQVDVQVRAQVPGADEALVGDRAVEQAGAEGAGGHAAGVALLVPVVVVGDPPVVFQALREAGADLGELLVQALGEEAVQLDDGREAHGGAAHRQQHHEAEGEAGAQGAGPGQPGEAGADMRTAHVVTGFRTYPAPRTVWIMGARPASTFLRR